MSAMIEPILHPVAVKDLRPTQMTVGLREVSRKRDAWRAIRDKDGGEFLGTHMIPAVIGPGGTYWLIDHHHLARALYEDGVKDVLVQVVAKLTHLRKKRFLSFMESQNWLHAYDAEGKRQAWTDLPRHIGKLTDDPYRSLAGEVRRAGGYAKNNAPYSEFLWADFFRDRLRRSYVENKFGRAITKAVALAHSHEAAYLPGFAGPDNGTAG